MTGIIDLFAGGGGIEEGFAKIGRRDTAGVEWWGPACEVAMAAGHARIGPGAEGDVSKLSPSAVARAVRWTGESTVGSPPCGPWSMAGKGLGNADAHLVLAGVEQIGAGRHPRGVLARLRHHCQDDRTPLVLEPLRWALELRPGWLMWEQTPRVLPLWQACAEVLRGVGYSVEAAVLQAEAYGVPQTRKRAILVARLGAVAMLPAPTHSRYHPTAPGRLDPGVEKWVSMAQALTAAGLPLPGDMLRSNYGTSGDPDVRGERPLSGLAPTVTSKINRNKWMYQYRSSMPAASVTIQQAAVLQSFPVGYPFSATRLRNDQFLAVGNSVPPLLAARIGEAIGAGRLSECAA